MKIVVTAKELMDRGLWLRYCEITGTNEWAVNEGLMDSDDEVTLSDDLVLALGLAPPEAQSTGTGKPPVGRGLVLRKVGAALADSQTNNTTP